MAEVTFNIQDLEIPRITAVAEPRHMELSVSKTEEPKRLGYIRTIFPGQQNSITGRNRLFGRLDSGLDQFHALDIGRDVADVAVELESLGRGLTNW